MTVFGCSVVFCEGRTFIGVGAGGRPWAFAGRGVANWTSFPAGGSADETDGPGGEVRGLTGIGAGAFIGGGTLTCGFGTIAVGAAGVETGKDGIAGFDKTGAGGGETGAGGLTAIGGRVIGGKEGFGNDGAGDDWSGGKDGRTAGAGAGILVTGSFGGSGGAAGFGEGCRPMGEKVCVLPGSGWPVMGSRGTSAINYISRKTQDRVDPPAGGPPQTLWHWP